MCVHMSNHYVFQDLEFVKCLKQIVNNECLAKEATKCAVCNKESDAKHTALNRCEKCDKWTHPMCAWLDCWHFEQQIQPNYQADSRLDKYTQNQLFDVFYKVAYNSKTLMTCHTCQKYPSQ